MLPKRMPADTMEELTTTKNNDIVATTTERTSEPHVVVACPSCRTKFAVESSLVASYETPRFHCSRCDSIFEILEQHSEQAHPAIQNHLQQWVLDDPSDNAPRSNDPRRPTATEPAQPSLKPTDFTLGTAREPDTFEQHETSEPIESRVGLSLLGFRPSASRKHSTSLTRAEAQSFSAHISPAPNSPAQNSAAQISAGELPEDGDPFTLFDAPGGKRSVGGSPAQTTPAAPSTGASAPFKAPAKNAVGSGPTKASSTPENVMPSSSAGRLTLLGKLSEKNQNLARLSLPVLCAFGFVSIIGITSRFVPLSIDSVFGAVTPSFVAGRIAQLPPPEISVQDLNLHLEKTQSKELIPVIRGFVSNASDKTFEDVSIEALGFNARGELLIRARAPLRSALSREKISDLPLETVKKFQNALSASNASIKGGEKVPFSVALFLTDAAPQEVTYFSARVFSVGRARDAR